MSEKFYTIVCHDTSMAITYEKTNLVSIIASDDLSAGELKKMKYIKKQLGKFDKIYPNLKYTWLGAITNAEAKSAWYSQDTQQVFYNEETQQVFYNEETQMGVYSERGDY